MNRLIDQIMGIRGSPVKQEVESRLEGFRSFDKRPAEDWFSELCFCILTANSRAITALNIQEELGHNGFCGYPHRDLSQAIKRHKHRFHNTKAQFIIDARCHLDIKQKMQQMVREKGEHEAREWLVKNIKGIGYKEASHFLRNVGYNNLAILDRHILGLLHDDGMIDRPKSLTGRDYLNIEEKFISLADEANMSPAELDMYMWYMKTGEVLK
ncbi:MAG: N-glycosylase/DNA lyase [Nanoarchaeota archaeon]|nr:N-glycosylase/DNA lyase [Nanoarchaeota archaeon]